MTSSASGVALGAIGQIALTVADLDRAVAFFRDTLRLPFLFAAPPQLAFFDAGGVRLMLSAPENGAAANAGDSVLYFRVADIIEAHTDLAARGLRFADEPHLIARMPDHELWMCFFRDPDAHLLALMGERPLGTTP